jgi:hypothetical protein
MFFPFFAATIVGAGAVKLGAMSVTISVLTLALQALIFANVMGIAYVIWRKYQENHPPNPALPSLSCPALPA